MKTATEDLRERMRKASANIAAGVRLHKPELEADGRRHSGLAHIENQILLHQAYLTEDDRTALAQILLFGSTTPDNAAEIAPPLPDSPVERYHNVAKYPNRPFYDQDEDEDDTEL